jgi:hypothetical protein
MATKRTGTDPMEEFLGPAPKRETNAEQRKAERKAQREWLADVRKWKAAEREWRADEVYWKRKAA